MFSPIQRSVKKCSGSLKLIIGPMFSGKTSRLQNSFRGLSYIKEGKAVILNYCGDNRYGEMNNEISTHDLVKTPCVQLQYLNEWECPSDVTHILINEAQFFGDLKDVVLDWVDVQKKHVIIFGLDGNYRREPIGQVLALIPFCDKVQKLAALCSRCRNGKPAPFSHRTIKSDEQVLIGTTDMYEALCRSCYITSNPSSSSSSVSGSGSMKKGGAASGRKVVKTKKLYKKY